MGFFSYLSNFTGFFRDFTRNSPPIKESFPQEPFIQIPCQVCQNEIIIEEKVYPGDVAVTSCGNCSTQWTIYCPSLVVRKTADIPKEIQSQVWGKLSENA